MKKSGPTPNPVTKITDLVDEDNLDLLMKKTNIPGMSAAYIDQQGNISTLELGTEASTKKVSNKVKKDSVFEAASLSKPLFAYLVLKLAAANQLDLDAPLHTFFERKGSAENVRHSEWVNNEELKKITPRMLLLHRTGLPIGGKKGEIEFQFNPGEHFGYSGIGINCLQEAIEHKTGRTLEDLAQEYVFKPCKMEHSSFHSPDDPQSELIAANSLHTTATDYARFVLKWMNDPTLQESFTFDQNFTMQRDPWAVGMRTIENEALEIKRIENEDLNRLSWGLGVGLQRSDNGITAFHTGDMNDSRALMAFNLKDKTAIVYFANSANGLALADALTSRTVNLNHGLNYVHQKYGFERDFKHGWQVREKQRFAAINRGFPPDKPFSKMARDNSSAVQTRRSKDAITPQYTNAKEQESNRTTQKLKPQPSAETEIKVFDPNEPDRSKKWKRTKIKK